MTLGEPEPNPTSDHILDWLEGSVSFFPSFLEDPYSDPWCVEGQELDQELIINNNSSNSNSLNSNSTITTATSITQTDHHHQQQPTVPNHPQTSSDLSKKRKPSEELIVPKAASQNGKRNQKGRINNDGGDEGDAATVEHAAAPRRSTGTKRGGTKSAGNNFNNGNNREGRWAEQLLNPCATAIAANNLTRVQHLLYVLHELASPTGDANHRLADHGLRALTHHLSSPPCSTSLPSGPITFASTKPQFFQKSLLKFYDVSPWFIFHNTIANASILQVLGEQQDRSRNLHILDIGVSHGAQWPTLLEALTRRPGGPPPLVRLTVIATTMDSDQTTNTPFAVGPPGDNYSSRLLFFAKSMSINLQINRIDNYPLQNLNSQVINSTPDETLIICTQFRLHHLSHNNPDNRSEFLRVLRNLDPKGVILSENNMDCSCKNCGDFAIGFARRVDFLWKFLDSTSAAFKGRESDERRVMEGEAAKALMNLGQMNEGKEKWCERMRSVGFSQEVFGEDATEGARSLLRKYDGNWEMRVEERDGCVGLWWKGQPVSFCSVWKLSTKNDN